MVSRTTYLNMVPSSVRPVVYVSQYDVDTNCLFFYLYNGSDIFTIPSGAHVFISGAKPDNTLFSYSCTYSGNKVTANLEEQMTLVKGDVTCEISIQDYNSGQVVGSANFVLRVEESPYYKAAMSKTDIDNLHDIIKIATEEATNRAETAANSANKSSTDAIASANAARTYSESAKNTLSEVKSTASDCESDIWNTTETCKNYINGVASDCYQSIRDTTEKFNDDVSKTAEYFKDEAAKLAEQYSREAAKDAESWAVGGTGTRTGEDMDNSKYYSEVSKSNASAAEEAAKLAKDYSTIVMPDLYLDPDTGIVYEKTGVGIDVQLDEDSAKLYWKITVG